MRLPRSNRLQALESYPFAVINEKVAELRARGIEPVDFGVGDPRTPTPEIVREECKTALDRHATSGYPPYKGSQPYREAVAAWVKRRFGVELDPETQITSTIGSKEGIFNFPLAYVNPGDVVLCPTPAYPPYVRGTQFAGGSCYFLPLLAENDFLPDLDAVPEAVARKAKVLWLNYPNSPTGAVATLDFFKRTLEWGRERGILVVNDEAYSEISFQDEPHPSILQAGIEGALSFQSMSKRSAMTGWRIGWTAGDTDAVLAFREVKTNIDSGTPWFIQDAAIAALQDDAHVKAMVKEYRIKRDLLADTFVGIGLPDCRPAATIHFWQRVPEGMDGLTFAQRLVEPGIAVVGTPGAWISDPAPDGGNPGHSYVRFSLVPTIEETQTACARIKANASKLLT